MQYKGVIIFIIIFCKTKCLFLINKCVIIILHVFHCNKSSAKIRIWDQCRILEPSSQSLVYKIKLTFVKLFLNVI